VAEFTLVRHSGYAVGADPWFEDAVEVRELTGQQTYLVRSAGGTLYATLAIAEAAAAAANHPGGAPARGAAPLQPRASGFFSSLRLGGAEIYVPRDTVASGAGR